MAERLEIENKTEPHEYDANGRCACGWYEGGGFAPEGAYCRHANISSNFYNDWGPATHYEVGEDGAAVCAECGYTCTHASSTVREVFVVDAYTSNGASGHTVKGDTHLVERCDGCGAAFTDTVRDEGVSYDEPHTLRKLFPIVQDAEGVNRTELTLEVRLDGEADYRLEKYTFAQQADMTWALDAIAFAEVQG